MPCIVEAHWTAERPSQAGGGVKVSLRIGVVVQTLP